MNPDCRLMAGAIATLRSVLDAHPQCAVVGPRILNPDGTVQGSARGDPNMLTGLFGRTTLLRRIAPFLPVAKRNIVVERGDAQRRMTASPWTGCQARACLRGATRLSPFADSMSGSFSMGGRGSLPSSAESRL
jgi:GT2 family glycosyltransferase